MVVHIHGGTPLENLERDLEAGRTAAAAAGTNSISFTLLPLYQ